MTKFGKAGMMGANSLETQFTTKKRPIMSKIPTKLNEKQFCEHVLPYLSIAQRGYPCQIPLHRVFNYLLYWLHTGWQWHQIAIAKKTGADKKKLVRVPFTTIFPGGVMMKVSKICGLPAFSLSKRISI